MGDIGIIAGILDDGGGCRIAGEIMPGERESRRLTARQRDGDGIGELTSQQGRVSGLGRRGGTGAGGPAITEGARGFFFGQGTQPDRDKSASAFSAKRGRWP